MYYDCKYLIANDVLIDFHVSMEYHIDDDARQEEERMVAQHPMFSSHQTGKNIVMNYFY